MCPVLSDMKSIYKAGLKISPKFCIKLDIIKITFSHCCKESIRKLIQCIQGAELLKE
jgi:hypothetical protein